MAEEGSVERKSSLDIAMSTAMASGADSADPLSYPQRAPTTFSTPTAFGAEHISDDERLFASQREPILKWLTWWVPVDIFDNWFEVIDPDKPEDKTLDRVVQRVLGQLNAKQTLVRLFTFERRYGTSLLLCAYTGFGPEASWNQPIYETASGLNLPIDFQGKGARLLQITPYPWPRVTVEKHDLDDSSLRFGKPSKYKIDRGIETDNSVVAVEEQPIVDWSRTIHAATRLDENSYEGVSALDAVWDDAVGGRNMHWGMYETMFRVGSGFPWFKFPWATRKQIEDWIGSGEITSLNARGYFVSGQEGEEIEFIGPKGVTLNPEPYNEMWLHNIAIATRIPKDMLKGVSAGTVAGSEVNERSYWNFIKSEQELVEPVVRELIDRLIDSGQVYYEDKRRSNPRKDYEIRWNFPEIISEKDRATVDFLREREKSQSLDYLTVNEIRSLQGLPEVPDGDVVLGILRAQKIVGQGFQETENKRPSPEERRPQEQAEEETQKK